MALSREEDEPSACTVPTQPPFTGLAFASGEKLQGRKKKCLFSKFHGDPVVKNLPCNAEDTGLIPDKGTKPVCHMPK